MSKQVVIAAILIMLTTPSFARGHHMACLSGDKIEAAYCLLGGKYDRLYIASIDANRGRFKNAKELADWIVWGDR